MKQNQLGRKIEMLQLLQSGMATTADQLANALRISKRTVFRDFLALRNAGIDVRFDKPRQTYHISPHFGLRLPKLTADDVAVLVAAVYLSPLYANRHYWGQIKQTIAKMLEKLEPPDRDAIVRMVEGLDVNVQQFQQQAPCDKVLFTLIEAIRWSQDVRLTYFDPQLRQELRTKVRPEKLILSETGWLLKGRSTWHRDQFQFDVNHILKADQVAASPPDRPGSALRTASTDSFRGASAAYL
jgi:predicted DNA-binding transcriptional regulator YafY